MKRSSMERWFQDISRAEWERGAGGSRREVSRSLESLPPKEGEEGEKGQEG